MPYVIRKDGPPDKPFCVYTKGEGGSRHGCHESEEKARAQQAALYVHAPDVGKGDLILRFGPAAVKAMGEGRVGGYVVQWGDEATKDAQDEWFTPETDFDTEFPCRASIRYNHGLDPVLRNRRLTYGSIKQDEVGLWVEAQLDLADRHQRGMYGMAGAGRLGWSSAAISLLTDPPRDDPGGPIKSWPGIAHDCSLTPMPADRRNVAIALKSWEPPPLEDLVADTLGPHRTASLNETLEQWIEAGEVLAGDLKRHAVKAGRKQFTHARIERLNRARNLIDEMLAETAPREEDAEEAEPPAPVTGSREEAGMPARYTAPGLPDLHDLYTQACRQLDGCLLNLSEGSPS